MGIGHWAKQFRVPSAEWGISLLCSEFRVGNLTSLLSTQHSALLKGIGHWALGIGNRQGKNLFNNSPLSPSSPPAPLPLCPSAPLPLCPSAPLPLCPPAPLPLCPSAPLPLCPLPPAPLLKKR